ncbi:hypothetical protein B0T19DRAFT_405539 [Cercophora scortea]|uniref:Uncharacterized protein n=1 Tax=Cercophora scortea TaxID=314031 RepID=A0AAE0M3D8_9PEZI|nr:hypothetical protein B0T19DRAFT_405539 [Cercophora scortea]
MANPHAAEHIIISNGGRRCLIAKPPTFHDFMAQASLMFGFHQSDWYDRVCARMDYRRPCGEFVTVELSHSSWAAVKDGEEVRCEFFNWIDTGALAQPHGPKSPPVRGPWDSNSLPVPPSPNQSDFTLRTARPQDFVKERDPRDTDWSENGSLGDWNTGNADKSKRVSWDLHAPRPAHTISPDISPSPPLSPPRWAESQKSTTPRMAGAWVTDASSLGSPRSDTKTTEDDNWSPRRSDGSPRPRSVSPHIASVWKSPSPEPVDNEYFKQASKSTGVRDNWDDERLTTPPDLADWTCKKVSNETRDKVENWDSGNIGAAGQWSDADSGVSWDRLDEGSIARLNITRGPHDKHKPKTPQCNTAPANCTGCRGSGECLECTACDCTKTQKICLQCRGCWCGGKCVCMKCDGLGTVRDQVKVERW